MKNKYIIQDIDFSVWGRDKKPVRTPSKHRSPRPAKDNGATKEHRGPAAKKRAAQQLENDNSTAASQLVIVKFNFRRPKRKRQNSVVSVDLEDDCQDISSGRTSLAEISEENCNVTFSSS
jgi:hypothetical protein